MERCLVVIRLAEYMRKLITEAKGNAVGIKMKGVRKAVETEVKGRSTAVIVLKALASLGLLEVHASSTPKYILRRGSPLWAVLEAGKVEQAAELIEAAVSNYLKRQLRCKNRRRRRVNVYWS
jgi:hypothetical protein